MPKVLIIIVAGFIIIAGAAVAVMYQMEIGPFAAKIENAVKTPVDRPPKLPKFISMTPIVVSIFKGNRVAGIIQILIHLETKASNEEKLKRSVPRLKDAFLRDLNGYLPRMLRNKKKVDVNIVKQRLQIIGERTIGKGILDSVLIQSVLNRGTKTK